MENLRKPKSAKKPKGSTAIAREWHDPDDDGVGVRLEHHHLMQLKDHDGKPIAGRLKSGHKVHFHGVGVVERSESRSDGDGERHSATLRLHRGHVKHHEEEKPRERPRHGAPRYPKIAGEYVH